MAEWLSGCPLLHQILTKVAELGVTFFCLVCAMFAPRTAQQFGAARLGMAEWLNINITGIYQCLAVRAPVGVALIRRVIVIAAVLTDMVDIGDRRRQDIADSPLEFSVGVNDAVKIRLRGVTELHCWV